MSAVFGALFFGLFAEVLLQERNFIYRDAGHFYYPYFKMIAQQWGQGEIPLWNPHENGGEPLAGNPTSSVFYPLKLLFLLPYAVAYKWYLMIHIAIAFANCFIAARAFGVSVGGASISAFAYAFSGSVFFQLYNIVFLCGAAWLPLGVVCVARLVHTPTWRWAIGLGVVLALQVLGGDPEIAFVTGLISLPYALYFHNGFARGSLLVAAFAAVGFGLVQFRLWYPQLALAAAGSRGWQSEVAKHPLYATAVAGLPAVGAFLLAVAWFRSGRGPTTRSIRLLAGAGLAGFLLSAVQVLPTIDLVRVSDRASPEAPHESVAFSFFPGRLPELVVPSVFGRQLPVNSRWAPFQSIETGIWNPSVYFGLIPLLLACTAFAWRRGTTEVRLFTWLALIMFWVSIGKFGGVMWLFDPNLGQKPNVVHAEQPARIKIYGHSDGLYRVLEETVPGFRSFRYPAKMLVVATFAMAVLAGFGWERLVQQPIPRLQTVTTSIAATVVGLVLLVVLGKPLVLRAFEFIHPTPSGFGPFVAHEAWSGLVWALLHTAVVSIAFRLLLRSGPQVRQTPRWQYAVIMLAAADLFGGNRWLVLTDSQEVIDSKPTVVQVIEEYEKQKGEAEPFRVYRTRIYEPPNWRRETSPERMLEMSRWERNTIQPKYALPFGVDYTTTTGTMAIYDVEFFFAPWTVRAPSAIRERHPQFPNVIVYYPKTGLDLWNTKYFVIPRGHVWDDEDRGVFTLMGDRSGQPLPVVAESPPNEEDYMILENTEAFPRAWVVHRAEFIPPIRYQSKQERRVPMERLLYRSLDLGMKLWQGRDYGDYPLQSQVMLEYTGTQDLRKYQSGGPPLDSETVRFNSYTPTSVEMTVKLESPGFLVLADTYHRGWTATVDGQPAELIRANRAMRAVPVPAGEHVVVMRYFSMPFAVGAALSLCGWGFAAAAACLGAASRLRSTSA